MKKIALAVLCVLTAFAVTGCSGKRASADNTQKGNKLAGVWEWERENVLFILNSDGSASLIAQKIPMDGTWTHNEKTFTIDMGDDNTLSCSYSFEGDILKAEIEGDTLLLTKKKNWKNQEKPAIGVWELEKSKSTPFSAAIGKIEFTDDETGRIYYEVDAETPIGMMYGVYGDSLSLITQYGPLWYDVIEYKDGLLYLYGEDPEGNKVTSAYKKK